MAAAASNAVSSCHCSRVAAHPLAVEDPLRKGGVRGRGQGREPPAADGASEAQRRRRRRKESSSRSPPPLLPPGRRRAAGVQNA